MNGRAFESMLTINTNMKIAHYINILQHIPLCSDILARKFH